MCLLLEVKLYLLYFSSLIRKLLLIINRTNFKGIVWMFNFLYHNRGGILCQTFYIASQNNDFYSANAAFELQDWSNPRKEAVPSAIHCLPCMNSSVLLFVYEMEKPWEK